MCGPEAMRRKPESASDRTGAGRSSETGQASINDKLTPDERERLIEEMKQAARLLMSDPEIVRHEREIQADLDAIDDTLEQIEAEERAQGADPGEKWWE
jgi:hypothetical protein